jgi:hypothetical protein
MPSPPAPAGLRPFDAARLARARRVAAVHGLQPPALPRRAGGAVDFDVPTWLRRRLAAGGGSTSGLPDVPSAALQGPASRHPQSLD